jgi:hypothetical protein
MAVSNPATLESAYTEFGAPQGTPLSSFLRNGAYVPNTSANANVPTALPISLSQLAGAVKYVNVSATMSPTSMGSSCKLSQEPWTIGTAQAIASGGTGSYTYTWSRQSGSAVIQGSPSGAFCSFSVSGAGVSTYSAVWQCVVSDGTSSATVTVSVSMTVTAG